ncbi:hypothetical protein CCR75_000674 [Bremia lactucae]|uniref:RRM domain-containing protein n=1 Tax=Bremia lactucae TaxID=4779 RepID=A0A976FEG1_BRELC|nr:hypothetical protein CCR75_000674 [Bremia lactucae]
MDLYADLPLAKGAKASSALDVDGKLKVSISSSSSVWASAPLMVPQAAKNKNKNVRTAVVTSVGFCGRRREILESRVDSLRCSISTSLLPTALAAARGKSSTRSADLLEYKPASMATSTTTVTQAFQKSQEKGEEARPASKGLGYIAATEVSVVPSQQKTHEDEGVGLSLGAAGAQFFQATYRDEYHPARPNSYEAYCKERDDRKRLDKVKKELSRRQRDQERESKLEREQLAKDLAEGRAPTMTLSLSVGRGRGMTMPAWMRKKIEENAAMVASQPESERDVDRESQLKSLELSEITSEGQFDDAMEQQGGLAFSSIDSGMEFSISSVTPSLASSRLAFGRKADLNASSCVIRLNKDRASKEQCFERHPLPELDEFGREIRHEPKGKLYDDRGERHKDRRKSSSKQNDRRDHLYTSHVGHPISEKRRRLSGWDRTLPNKIATTSRVVLLKNMVGPGEVDEELQDEVKEECQEKYGLVTKCTIHEVTGKCPPEEAVWIFVQFKDVKHATKGIYYSTKWFNPIAFKLITLCDGKALTGLNGRFFGGRKVKALYYDEGKFERMDFTSL